MIKDFIRPRLARLGKIKLGKRATSKNGNEYPSDLPCFRVPEEVAAIYGESPTELDVMVPSADIEKWFPTELQRWGCGEKLHCHGDGETALMWSDEAGGWQEIDCGYQDCPHYAKGDCSERGMLMVILPKVSLAGVYQIDTGSFYGVNNVQNEFATLLTVLTNLTGCPDMIRGVRFKLTRELQQINYYDDRTKARKSVTKALLHLRAPALSEEAALQLAARFRGTSGPMMGDGSPVPMPALPGEEDLMALPPAEEAEVPTEGINECPADLVAGASPVGPDLGQKSAWAALLEQVAEMGKDVGRFESTICRNVNREASRFDDLAGETEAPVALQQAADAIANYQTKQQQQRQPAPEPQPEPEPQQPAATAAKAQPRRTSSKQQQADAPAQAADGGSLGF